MRPNACYYFSFIYWIAADHITRLFPAITGHRKVLHLAFFHAAYRTLPGGGAGYVEARNKAFAHRTTTEQMGRGSVTGQRSGQIIFYFNQELGIGLRRPPGGILHFFGLRGRKLHFFVQSLGFKQRPSVGASAAYCLHADHTKHQVGHLERLAAQLVWSHSLRGLRKRCNPLLGGKPYLHAKHGIHSGKAASSASLNPAARRAAKLKGGFRVGALCNSAASR